MESEQLKLLGPIEIAGFKSIKQCKLDLRNVNFLIGANGSGKSNFIGFFKFLQALCAKRLQEYTGIQGGPDAILHFRRKQTNALKAVLSFGSLAYQFCLSPTANNQFTFTQESVCESPSDCTSLGSGHVESKLELGTRRGCDQFVREGLANLRVYHFHDTGETSVVKQVNSINDNVFLKPDASNLSAYLFLIKESHPICYRQILNTVRLVAPFIKDFHLRPHPSNPTTIQFEWVNQYDGTPFTAHALSDGTLRFICLTTLLLQPSEKCPNTILLDEPELGLHPQAVSFLADMIKTISLRKQVIAATQSPELIDHFEAEDIIVTDLVDGSSRFERLSSD